MEYFHNNWLTWKYAYGESTPVKWKIEVDSVMVTDPRLAAKDAAEKIYQKFGEVALLFSGGLDSQVMLLAFKDAGVPFKVVIVDYDGKNEHDISTAKIFCSTHVIEPSIFKFDALQFLVSGEYLIYANRHDCQSPQFCVHLKWYEEIYRRLNIPLVLGGNTFYTGIDEFDKWRFGYHHGYNQLSYQRASVPVIGSFLSYTPELAFSLWANLIPAKHSRDFFENRTIEHEVRLGMYRRSGFDVVAPPEKYTGFEQIKDLIDEGHFPGFFEKAFRKPITSKAVSPAAVVERTKRVNDWIATHHLRVSRAHGIPIAIRRR